MSDPKPNQSCSNCRFYSDERKPQCRRKPPVIVVVPQANPLDARQIAMVPQSMFPAVQPELWCGEWRGMESAERKLES